MKYYTIQYYIIIGFLRKKVVVAQNYNQAIKIFVSKTAICQANIITVVSG